MLTILESYLGLSRKPNGRPYETFSACDALTPNVCPCAEMGVTSSKRQETERP
jgi:hypothetical protein